MPQLLLLRKDTEDDDSSTWPVKGEIGVESAVYVGESVDALLIEQSVLGVSGGVGREVFSSMRATIPFVG